MGLIERPGPGLDVSVATSSEEEDGLNSGDGRRDNFYVLFFNFRFISQMAFRGKEPIRTKIIINDRILEQASQFNYLGIVRNYDINVKLDMFLSLIHI